MDDILNSLLLKEHSGELLIFALFMLVMISLFVLLPQVLRANLRRAEMSHEQRLRSLEKGLPLPHDDDRTRLAGRIALLVPMVVVIATATVTSFLVVYKSENLFAVSLSIWIVAGVICLAAITGGVALMGRLALLQAGEFDEEEDEEPSERSYMN
jgi:hypothetical protein